jgi:hypothetical protein
VGELPGRRDLEAGHLDPLGIHRPEDVADHPVLSPRVGGLEDHQEPVAPLGVEQFLFLAGLGLGAGVGGAPVRIAVGQAHVATGGDPVAFHVEGVHAHRRSVTTMAPPVCPVPKRVVASEALRNSTWKIMSLSMRRSDSTDSSRIRSM